MYTGEHFFCIYNIFTVYCKVSLRISSRNRKHVHKCISLWKRGPDGFVLRKHGMIKISRNCSFKCDYAGECWTPCSTTRAMPVSGPASRASSTTWTGAPADTGTTSTWRWSFSLSIYIYMYSTFAFRKLLADVPLPSQTSCTCMPSTNFLQMYLCLPQTSCKCTYAFHKFLANVPQPSTNFLQMCLWLPQTSYTCMPSANFMLMYFCLPQILADVPLPSKTFCKCSSSFPNFLQMYLCVLKLLANVCTSAFPNFLQMYLCVPKLLANLCTSAFPKFLQMYLCPLKLWQKYLCFHKFFFALESDSYFSSRKVTFFSGSGWGFLKHRLFVSWIPT